MITGLHYLLSRTTALAIVVMLVFSPMAYAGSGTEGTVYDPQILKRMKFSSQQLPKVKSILNQSEKSILQIFAKYRINPKAKPDFDLLRAASRELQALESWEKKQMKKVLSKNQYADYLEIQQATTAAVIKATRDD